MVVLGIILGLIWGGVWAAYLQYTEMGTFLAVKRTWITVVIGVGGDLLILLLIVPLELWWQILGVITASSVFIIVRSLYNEHSEQKEMLNDYKDQIGEQDEVES